MATLVNYTCNSFIKLTPGSGMEIHNRFAKSHEFVVSLTISRPTGSRSHELTTDFPHF